MRITVSEMKPLALALLVAGTATSLAAQEAPQAPTRPASEILASEVELSRGAAELRLELEEGDLDIALRDGEVLVDGERIGEFTRSDALDRSWRDLLTRAMDTPNDELAALLAAWSPPSGAGVGGLLDRTLETLRANDDDDVSVDVIVNDEVAAIETEVVGRLQSRIEELEAMVDDLEDESSVQVQFGPDRREWDNPLRAVGRGLSGMLATVALYVVLVVLAFGLVYFGRSYLEGVADTARHYTLRSWAVGFAATFLAVPAYVLGIVALAISIVGIPLLLAWIPLFPVAIALAAMLGYIGVAHASGEALAERRLSGSEWYSKGNSFYYVLTGLGLLLIVFLAAHFIEMAGAWLGFLHGLLMFLGVVITWAAFTIGFGAVLLSRAGTRPLMRDGVTREAAPAFEEESHA